MNDVTALIESTRGSIKSRKYATYSESVCRALVEALEAAEARIAEQQETLKAARSYVKEHAAGDGHAFGVLRAIDLAAGISVKGE